ncbi:MAG TPA: OB-fold domain-containing protein [Caulobacteraceae bacterium]|nr:OB-fold domain-containing protein [Caulobacteraceae bacterium]
MAERYLPEGLPIPVPEPNGLSAPYWEGLKREVLMVQRNTRTGAWQFPPQWIAHDDQSFDLEWAPVEPKGVIYSWTRVWHPVHPALANAGPYIVVVVELPHAGGVRMLGNLLGDPRQEVVIGAPVACVFEHHPGSDPPYSLAQWRVAPG